MQNQGNVDINPDDRMASLSWSKLLYSVCLAVCLSVMLYVFVLKTAFLPFSFFVSPAVVIILPSITSPNPDPSNHSSGS